MSRLGAGAMGVVYEAIERTLRRTVALKVLPEDVTRDPVRRARFIREARAAAAVTHATLLTIYQVGTVDERVFIAMELVRGQSLRDLLAAGPLPVALARRIGIDIATGLGRAHAAGIVHRDVKPDNVMVSHDGAVKVLDFGIARLAEGSALGAAEGASTTAGTGSGAVLTVEGGIIGTPGYMAPEQSTGGPVDARADVFALGATLYEMVAGLRPFPGGTPIDMLIASARDPFVPLAAVRPDVPPAFAAIIERCLAKSPADRYPDGDALASALQASATTAPNVPLLAMDTLGGAPGAPPVVVRSAPSEVPVTPSPVRGRTRVRPFVIVVAAAALALGGLVVFLLTRSSDGTPMDAVAASLDPRPDVAPSAPPMAAPYIRGDDPSVVACASFESIGTDEPGGWLGAAAADQVCNRVAVLLGGTNERTRVPAELLALPRGPTDDFPLDPYGAPDARKKTIDAAKKVGPRWIDGRVAVVPEGMSIDVHVMQDDRLLAAGHGEGRNLPMAVRRALDRLVADGAIVPASALLPGAAWWSGARTIPAALAVLDFDQVNTIQVDLGEALAALEAHAADLRPEALLFRRLAADPALLTEIRKRPLPPLDDTSALGRLWSGSARAFFATDDEKRAFADELATLLPTLTEPMAQSTVANTEGGLRLGLGQADESRELILATVERHPRGAEWRLLSWAAHGTPWAGAAARASAAWAPADPDGWTQLGEYLKDPTPEERARFHLRAALLAPDGPMWNLELTRLYVQAGQPVRARTFAARMGRAGAVGAGVSEVMLAIIEASEGALGRAASRSRDALMRLERFGSVKAGHSDLSFNIIQISRITGAITEVSDAFAQRFVLADPPRLSREMGSPSMAAETCAEASPAVAKACHARLRALLAEGWFTDGHPASNDVWFTVAERFAAGDMQGVAEAFRPQLVAIKANGYAARAFDAIGDPDTASRIDAVDMKRAAYFHGATLGHVREAHRMVARKDFAAARTLAQTVIDAWSTADVQVPAVAEMKALLASLPANTEVRRSGGPR